MSSDRSCRLCSGPSLAVPLARTGPSEEAELVPVPRGPLWFSDGLCGLSPGPGFPAPRSFCGRWAAPAPHHRLPPSPKEPGFPVTLRVQAAEQKLRSCGKVQACPELSGLWRRVGSDASPGPSIMGPPGCPDQMPGLTLRSPGQSWCHPSGGKGGDGHSAVLGPVAMALD